MLTFYSLTSENFDYPDHPEYLITHFTAKVKIKLSAVCFTFDKQIANGVDLDQQAPLTDTITGKLSIL